MIHVVVGIIIHAQTSDVLIAQRLPHQEKPGVWEFPGGKVEAGEDAFAALQRELLEEVGIEVVAANPWMKIEYQYPHKTVLLDTWMVDSFIGQPHGAEGQNVCWVPRKELLRREFPEANSGIIAALV